MEMECWSVGGTEMECWSSGVMGKRISLAHYSTAPLLHCSGFTFLLEDPGVLAPAALGGVDHERTGPEGHARQASGNDRDLFSGQNEGAEVDVPALHAVVAKGWRAGQRNNWLRDVIARILFYLFLEALAFRLRRLGADEHSVAATLVHRFDHELGNVVENVS